VQPNGPLTKISSLGCQVVHLGQLLSVFGRAYEVSFFDPTYKPPTNSWYTMLGIILALDVVMIVLLTTCHRRSVQVVNEKSKPKLA